MIVTRLIKMQLCGLVFLFLLTHARTQSIGCVCTCCRSFTTGQPCPPISLPIIPINGQYCVLETCLEQCRANYFECQGNTAVDQLTSECILLNNTITTTAPVPYNCRCDCCNTGSSTCTPVYIGNTRAYSCRPGACSIACEQQYPNQCKSGSTGVTQGECTDTTTITTVATATTTTGPWLSNTCECISYQSSVCGSTTFLGVTSASLCAASSCTQACRIRYPLPSDNQTIGKCISDSAAKRSCNCQCCGTSNCIDYKVTTNEICERCGEICVEYSPCASKGQVRLLSCNHSRTLFSYVNVILIISLSIFLFSSS